MVKLRIDGREVEVGEGATILDAAERLGIRIPTLCHVPGFPPSASCFICAVQVEGRPTLSPSCAMPAAEGMSVLSDTEEVRASRKMALELLLSDHVGDCVAPCRMGCPARLDIPGFIERLAAGDYRRSAEIAADFLAFPASLGRICPRLCEDRCRRSDHGEPLTVAYLHRFAADRDLASGSPYVPKKEKGTGKRVAVVGAGPAGLTAAYNLLRRGHGAVVFDAHSLPGGMLRYGIPGFRLPREILDGEIAAVRALGGEFRMGKRLGRDFTLEDLRMEFDAVFLALGAQGSRGLGCPGEELGLPAVGFLEKVTEGRPPEIGAEVIVIGGGNTAMDVSRTAVRLGAKSVRVFYRRTRREMPCLMAEVEAAEEEGVGIEYLVAPVRLEEAGGGRLRLTLVRMALGEPDESGRARPVPVEGSEFTVEATSVISAIGQEVEVDGAKAPGLSLSKRGIAVNALTLETNIAGVFAGGDAVTGADLAVRAVAAGKLAAASIDQYVGGRPVRGDPEMVTMLMGKLDELELAELYREIERDPRAKMPELPPEERRGSFGEVDLGLPLPEAMKEAVRCMGCGCFRESNCKLREYATEYDADPYRYAGERRKFRRDGTHPEVLYEPGKCILCGACVKAAEEAGEELGLSIVGRGFEAAVGVPFGEAIAQGLKTSAQKAVAVCPTGSLSLKGASGCGACMGSCPVPPGARS